MLAFKRFTKIASSHFQRESIGNLASKQFAKIGNSHFQRESIYCTFPSKRFAKIANLGGALTQNVDPRVRFRPLEIIKFDTKFGAEKVSKNDSKIIRACSQHDRQIAEKIHLFAKG